MKSSRETIESNLERPVSKAAILNLLANKLNCERAEVEFLFGKGGNNSSSDAVEIPDVKSH